MRLRIAALGLLAAVLAQPVAAQSFNQFIGFGDSTIDTGFYRKSTTGNINQDNAIAAALLLGAGGKFTEGTQAMSPEVLAAYFNLSGADPANQGGSNFATGGARGTLNNPAGSDLFTGAVSMADQINNYLAATGGHANGNALYLISIGGNDVAYALDTKRTDTLPFDPAQANAYLVDQAKATAAAIANLKAAGARYIIVPNLPEDLSSDPTVNAARKLYDATLWGSLAGAGVNFIPADINAVRLAIAANQASFGFSFIGTNAPACANAKGPPFNNAYALVCTPADLVTPDAGQTHLFADNEHLTSAGHKIFGDYYYSLVVAPSQISFLPETAVKTRAGLISNIQLQIDATRQQTGAFNAWVTGDFSYLQMDNAPGFPSDPGHPVSVAAGISAKLGTNVIAGIALSQGRITSSYSDGRGKFTQEEFAGSIYAGAANSAGLWGTLVASYGQLDYDVNRLVPVGITVQSNTGSSNGHNLSAAAQVGFAPGTCTRFGPLAGLAWQRVEVDGFTESGSFTRLGFGDQTRNSVVASVGLKATTHCGMFRPFAEVDYSWELASTDRDVAAFLITTTAPGYTMPAVLLDKSWGSATLGTNVILGPGLTGLVSASTNFGQGDVTTYGVQVGLNFAF